MVKHIVFWNMKKEANGNDAATNIKIAAAKLDEGAAQFPKLKSISHHTNIFSGGHYWDYVEEMVFEDVEALKEWKEFPPHVALHDFVEEVREARAAVDYEFDEL